MSEEWFDDDMYITPYQAKKRDDSPVVSVGDDWSAEVGMALFTIF